MRSSCIVDAQFLFNEENLAFPKRVIIVGIRNNAPFVREIDYKLPLFSEQLHNEKLICQGRLKYELGIIDICGKNEEMKKILKNVDTIIAKTTHAHDFVKMFTSENSKLFMGET